MRKNLLRIFAILIILPVLFSCEKNAEPISLEGTWTIDTAKVYILITYEKSIAAEHPEAITFLINNKEFFREKLKNPTSITFTSQNIANMRFSDDRANISGTYILRDVNFTITNELFPDGIIGLTDNKKIEIYYNTYYMKQLLNQIITQESPSIDVLNRLIIQFDGVGTYKR